MAEKVSSPILRRQNFAIYYDYDIEILIAYQFRESLTAFCLALLLFALRFDSLDGRMAGNKYSPLVVTP